MNQKSNHICKNKAEKICLLGCSKGIKLANGLKNFYGFQSEKEIKKSFQIFKEIVEEDKEFNNKDAKHSLLLIGECYMQKGFEKEINLNKAIEYFEKSSNLGVSAAKHRIAKIYQKGNEMFGLKKNIRKAIQLFEESGDVGYSPSFYSLGCIYFKEDEIRNGNIFKSVKFFEKAIEMGDVSSYDDLAFIYQFGSQDGDLKKDAEKAIDLFEKGAELGDLRCINNLAILYGSD